MQKRKFWIPFGLIVSTAAIITIPLTVFVAKNYHGLGELKPLDSAKNKSIKKVSDLNECFSNLIYNNVGEKDLSEIFDFLGANAELIKMTEGNYKNQEPDVWSYMYMFKTKGGQEVVNNVIPANFVDINSNDFLDSWKLHTDDFKDISRIVMFVHDKNYVPSIKIFEIKKFNVTYIMSNPIKIFTNLKFNNELVKLAK